MVKTTRLWNGFLGHRYRLQSIGVDKVLLIDIKHEIAPDDGLRTVTKCLKNQNCKLQQRITDAKGI